MNVSKQDYIQVIRQLPRPTIGQTERFARYVSGAHSWYKHLPIHPKVPFIFYLDPGAGMNHVQTRGGETALVEITDESTRFHYTWQKTEDYRRRFGYWKYHAAYGTTFMFAGEGGVVNTAGAGLKILTESGDWVDVPSALVESGTARVSALVHSHPNFQIWALDVDRFGLTEIAEPDDSVMPSNAHQVLRRLWSLLQQERRCHPNVSEMCRAIPQQVLASCEKLAAVEQLAAQRAPGMGKGWDWPSDRFLEQLQAAGMEPGEISLVVKYINVKQTRRLTAKMYESWKNASPEWPKEAMLRVAQEIVEEQGQQLAGVTDTMNRFVRAVFSS
jgi:hypothetical protein